MSMLDYIKDRRIVALVLIVAIFAILDIRYGVHFGIEFTGGYEIPVVLAQPVNPTQMQSIISTLQQRLNTFGLKQIIVQGIGNREVLVILPTFSSSDLNQTLSLISQQGTFVGIVDGREVLNGTGILKGTIGEIAPIAANGTYEWAVQFFLTNGAADRFAALVKGKANYPLYMFINRPSNAAIVINQSLFYSKFNGAEIKQIYNITYVKGSVIPIILLNSSNSSISYAESVIKNYSIKELLANSTLPKQLLDYAKEYNITVKYYLLSSLLPSFSNTSLVQSWPAIGLVSTALLNPSITNGTPSSSYQISGFVPLNVSPQDMYAYAVNQEKLIGSVLSGGSLPVPVTPGKPIVYYPTLGKNILDISVYMLIAAVVLISIFITLRYKKPSLIIPIIITSLTELFLITSILGLIGTIDIAAFAGILAVLGTGIDAQIIITDEIISKGSSSNPRLVISEAFYIITTDVALLVIAMLPLFFDTSLVNIVGFSEATIIGTLLGILITRPAYAAIVSKRYIKK
ncbi:MAG: protein-export membrane protein SecD [Candidatus Micrarchaeota archaeon]|nr:MAG: protein-export membrane protein SecD [Candidatus Micrarchaeota archaeon]